MLHTFKTQNGTGECYLAMPPDGSGPGVLVLHAWWGLNDTIKTFCDQLALSGYVVFAPDLYHGKIAKTIPEAEALGGALDENYLQAKAEIADAVLFLNGQVEQADRGLAVIGFSLGVYYALDLSTADPEHIRSVIIYYGTGPANFSRSKAAYLGHFAENDEFEPPENVDELETAIREAGRPVTFYRYGRAEHWFCEPDRPQYILQAAELAWQRSLEFLRETL